MQIQLFGGFRIKENETTLSGLTKPRMQSLLAYLLLYRGAPQSRAHLAYTFWPESSEKQARTNLRRELLQLRRAGAGPGRCWHRYGCGHGDRRCHPHARRPAQRAPGHYIVKGDHAQHQAKFGLGVWLQCCPDSNRRRVLAPFEWIPDLLRQLNPILAAGAMAFSSISVVSNALRLRRLKL